MQHECMTAVLTVCIVFLSLLVRDDWISLQITHVVCAIYFVRCVVVLIVSDVYVCVFNSVALCVCVSESVLCMVVEHACVRVWVHAWPYPRCLFHHIHLCVLVTKGTHSSTCCHLNEQNTTHDMLTHGFADAYIRRPIHTTRTHT